MHYSSAEFGIWEYYQLANKKILYVLDFRIATFVQVSVIDPNLVSEIFIRSATQIFSGFTT
jgi:hypothetical protein